MTLVVRPLNAGEEHLFDKFEGPVSVGLAIFGRNYTDMVAKNEYRPAWTWVALHDDKVVARAAWWGGPTDTQPMTLDWLDFTHPEAAEALLKAAPFKTEYCLALPPHWRAAHVTHAAGQSHIDVAIAAGMKPLVERYRYTWTPTDGLPPRPGRLEFRSEPDNDVILDVLAQIQQGSLDAHKVADLSRLPPEEAAREELEHLLWFPGPRSWWKLAYTPGGDLVGITIPSRNYSTAVVAFIGVVPSQRGHGYAHDLLVECSHLLVEEGVDQIAADTDSTNFPMAANFKKAGYPITQERVFLSY